MKVLAAIDLTITASEILLTRELRRLRKCQGIGMWESLVIRLTGGQEYRRFKSGHPDNVRSDGVLVKPEVATLTEVLTARVFRGYVCN